MLVVLGNQVVQNDGWMFAVYLRAPAETCYDRIKKRARKEESGVPFVSTTSRQCTLDNDQGGGSEPPSKV